MTISSASGVQPPAPIRPALLIAMLVVAIALPSVGAAIAIPDITLSESSDRPDGGAVMPICPRTAGFAQIKLQF